MEQILLNPNYKKRRHHYDTNTTLKTPTTQTKPKEYKQKIADTRIPKENIFKTATKPKPKVITNNVDDMNKFHKYNRLGLDKAYADDKGLYYDKDKGTLFIAGTKWDTPIHAFQDVGDDIFGLPTGDTVNSVRYIDADRFIRTQPKGSIKTLVGHSLGASVSNELNKQYSEKGESAYKTVTYGAPNLSLSETKQPNNFRHSGDYISMLDNSGVSIGGSLNPLVAHSYSGYEDYSNNPEPDIDV
jgi:hypothetical protein